MKATLPTCCAVCGAQKREANHWFVIVMNSAGGCWQRFEDFEQSREGEEVAIVCGESCAVKTISRWFAER